MCVTLAEHMSLALRYALSADAGGFFQCLCWDVPATQYFDKEVLWHANILPHAFGLSKENSHSREDSRKYVAAVSVLVSLHMELKGSRTAELLKISFHY